jgi:transcriptional regulator with XRE-family HTH domain
MDNSKTFLSDNIKMIRNKLGLTQDGLAEKSGLALRTIQDIEYKKSNGRAGTINKIAHALGVQVEILYKDPHAKQEKNPIKRIGDMTPEELAKELAIISEKNNKSHEQAKKYKEGYSRFLEEKKESQKLSRSEMQKLISGTINSKLLDDEQLRSVIGLIESLSGQSLRLSRRSKVS